MHFITLHMHFNISLLVFMTPTSLHSFPTRRSSDLLDAVQGVIGNVALTEHVALSPRAGAGESHRASPADERGIGGDRKSTRLNSSHLVISYAVFCLKKKTNKIQK